MVNKKNYENERHLKKNKCSYTLTHLDSTLLNKEIKIPRMQVSTSHCIFNTCIPMFPLKKK